MSHADDEMEEQEEERVQQDDEEDAPIINLRIQNVVGTLNMNMRLDLDKISSTARNAEYNPRRSDTVLYYVLFFLL